jgi:transcriptional regulator with XRE-family HTH domain
VKDPLRALGLNIKRVRLKKGLSQEALAEKCDFDRTYISLVERGKRNPSFLNLIRLAKGLGTSLSNLISFI